VNPIWPVRAVAAGLIAAVLAVVLAACAAPSPQRPEPTRAETAAGFNLQLGIAYLRQNNLALAKEKLERALAQNPRDPNVHAAMALLHERFGDAAAADRAYRNAIRIDGRNPDIQNNYAVFLCRSGRVEDGVERFQAVARNPLYRTPDVAYTNAGVCLRSARRLDEAASKLARALTIRPNAAEAAFQLGDLDLERGKLDEARTRLDQYLAAFTPTPDLLLLGTRIARAQGDRLAEERFGRRLTRDFPESEQARSWARQPRGES